MGMGLFFGCCGSVFGVLVVLFIGSALVRASVAVANRVIGPIKTDTFGEWDDWDSDDEPAYVKSKRRGGEKAIPVPSTGLGMLICFIAGFFHFFFSYLGSIFIVGGVLGDIGRQNELFVLVSSVLMLPFSFVSLTVILAMLLPTTYRRAALVAFLHYFIAVAIATLIGGAIFIALG